MVLILSIERLRMTKDGPSSSPKGKTYQYKVLDSKRKEQFSGSLIAQTPGLAADSVINWLLSRKETREW